MKRLVFSLFAFAQIAVLSAAEQFISFTSQPGAINLTNATIGYSDNDYEGVKIALRNLQTDMERVLGKAPQLSPSVGAGPVPARTSGLTILVGTIGKNPAIDEIVNRQSVNRQSFDLKGKREKFIITTLPTPNTQHPTPNTILIAGSDRRGTIYGIYELSRQLGVSPWYWWADAPIAKHDEAWFLPGTYTDGEPAVEFRGLFLNDEAPCLTSWVKNTWGTDYGDHRFYEKVFELILRLKGNMLWPAMWGWAFYADDPENGPTADRMGVIMGTSHHEPMARNHQEYARHRQEWGAWNYQTNQAKLDQFFREGIERMKGTEDMVTIGMRGDGDEAMSDKADTQLMERIITNQRKIIKEVTGKAPEKTTQVWALYKEVQDYYDAGLRVPDDVMILISDDNWGDIRRVPVNDKERARKGGWGIYYHVDYVGAPRNTKWLNVTQTQQMFEQLSLAYDFGIQRMWILNVGDLKPMEYPIQLFMDMAWNPKEYTLQNVTDHTTKFFASVVGHASQRDNPSVVGHASQRDNPSSVLPRWEAWPTIAAEAAAIYNQNCQYMARVTPEMLDARTYNIKTGEWKQVADDYQRLELRALRLYDEIQQSMANGQWSTVNGSPLDFYRQLILFPVQAMANLYDMYYAQAMNQYLAKNNDPDANLWADRVTQCFRRDSLLCAAYNTDIAGGKWNGMMTQKHIGYRSWNDNFPHDMLPKTSSVEMVNGQSSMVNGQSSTVNGQSSMVNGQSSTVNGQSSMVNGQSSMVNGQSSMVNGQSSMVNGQSSMVNGGYTFEHSNGFVSMEAEHFYDTTADDGTAWTVYPYYGRTRSAVALTPYTAPVGNATLTYRFTLPSVSSASSVPSVLPDSVKVHVVVKSTLDFLNVGGHEYTVSLDGSEPQTVNFNKTLVDRQPYMYSEFYPTIARRVVEKVVTIPCAALKAQVGGDSQSSIYHELTLHPCHPGIVFEKIVIDFGGYQPSYLFMDESSHTRR